MTILLRSVASDISTSPPNLRQRKKTTSNTGDVRNKDRDRRKTESHLLNPDAISASDRQSDRRKTVSLLRNVFDYANVSGLY